MTSKLKAMIAAFAVLYGAEALADNTSPSLLSDKERATLETLMPEDFGNFKIHDEPRPFREKTFLNGTGEEIDLHTFDGSITMVNFWATWCPPCLKELPGMNKLQADLADDGLDVVAISIDRGGLRKAAGFWKRAKMTMGLYADPDKDLALEMGVIGLPVTAILGPDGREIGRLIGEAEWHTDEVKEMLWFLMEATGSSDPDQKEASELKSDRAG